MINKFLRHQFSKFGPRITIVFTFSILIAIGNSILYWTTFAIDKEMYESGLFYIIAFCTIDLPLTALALNELQKLKKDKIKKRKLINYAVIIVFISILIDLSLSSIIVKLPWKESHWESLHALRIADYEEEYNEAVFQLNEYRSDTLHRDTIAIEDYKEHENYLIQDSISYAQDLEAYDIDDLKQEFSIASFSELFILDWLITIILLIILLLLFYSAALLSLCYYKSLLKLIDYVA